MSTWWSRLLSERPRLFLLSLAIAVALWFYAGSTVRPPGEGAPTATLRFEGVEVTFAGLPDGWRASSAPEAVGIELRWPAATVLAVRPHDVQAVADLGGLQPGQHRVALRIQVPPGVTAVQATPPSVLVSLSGP
jgi:YbbR domain-containing protein